MLARIRTATEEKDSGFTLIELLVVVIIIGILAAIAIPTFLNQRKNGYRAAVKSDLRNAATAVESAAVDKNGDYTFLTPAGTEASTFSASGVEFKPSAGVTTTVKTVGTTTGYCLQAVHSSLPTTEIWYISKDNSSPRTSGC